VTVDIHAIARHYGGRVCNGNALIPTPGHSSRDRGTAIRANPVAPDGCLVACFNGSNADALAVKEMLRRDGFCDHYAPARQLSPAERRALRRERAEQERARLDAEQAAARAAAELWRGAVPADRAHRYLKAKALEPFGIRQQGRELLVPMLDASFRLWNLQRIRPDGFKLFLKDGRTAGLFWPHATHLSDGAPTAGPLVIGEGFATMAAVHSATGFGVVAALSARNLEPVALAMRALFTTRELILAADHDCHLAHNIGVEAATSAAERVRGSVATPRPEPCSARCGADFADIPRNQVAARIAAARRVTQ
jgi:putative DNA primase/helicase